jgi:hypothetical protein
MESYPRTHLRFVLAIVALVFMAALPASAQSNSAQAVLHIRINIVPVVMAPPAPEPIKPLSSGIAYNVPTSKSNVEVIEQTRPLSAPGSSGFQGAVLRTVTIVAR